MVHAASEALRSLVGALLVHLLLSPTCLHALGAVPLRALGAHALIARGDRSSLASVLRVVGGVGVALVAAATTAREEERTDQERREWLPHGRETSAVSSSSNRRA